MAEGIKKNTGLLLEKRPNVKDWKFLGYTGIDDKILRPDGQWDKYLPEFETQKQNNFDTYACVTYATLNCVETILLRKWGRTENYSDRFLATVSGTVCNRGNHMARVANALINHGCCKEDVYPFSADIDTCSDYYAIIPEKVKKLALPFKNQYDFRWEWVENTPETMKEALKYSPLTVVVHGGKHLVELYGYVDGRYWKCYDHYERKYKTFLWDYAFGRIMKFSLNQKLMPSIEIDNDTLVQEVEESGTPGLVLDNKIIVDDPALLLITWIMRNGGILQGKTKSLTKAEWSSFDKINLTKELIK